MTAIDADSDGRASSDSNSRAREIDISVEYLSGSFGFDAVLVLLDLEGKSTIKMTSYGLRSKYRSTWWKHNGKRTVKTHLINGKWF